MLFPSTSAAKRCVKFIQSQDQSLKAPQLRILDLELDPRQINSDNSETLKKISPTISAVIYPEAAWPLAKQYWQHSGDGVSSRRAEFCHALFLDKILVDRAALKEVTNSQVYKTKGPKRYQRADKASISDPIASSTKNRRSPDLNGSETRESLQFVEERFGRNLDITFLDNAKSAIRKRIAGCLTAELNPSDDSSQSLDANARGVTGLAEDDVYLYPCGMNSIFNTHRMMLEARGPMKSVSFGFPYVDTLKILEKFGPGCLFYGNGSSEDLDDLEQRLKSGERYLALFCEFPGNPLLKCPDLKRIRTLADAYDFAVVVDETIGNFINISVLPHADVVVSSLTKIFSGESNVMGGSAILNPKSRYYSKLKEVASTEYEDNYWAEDVMFMERNSRDFVPRIERVNANAEAICDILLAHPAVKEVYYPKHSPSRGFYDACRTPNGGYGGLLSVTFHSKAAAVTFFDEVATAKGPSLGTNFTLTSPYVILAHYGELDWAAQFGVPSDLVRISVGLEDTADLKAWFTAALEAAAKSIEK